ncbi:MAG: YchJ family metal-binding protein [Rhodocyclaceae bacterium]|nr:YchJ family metal-binding protein [Rhodocyclaceae bacterium]
MVASCPCGRPLPYASCCGLWHAGAPAPDAESLMRSRYTAYVLGLENYLLATWHATTRPAELHLATTPPTQWLGLTVKRHESTSAETAVVEFVARHKIGGRAQRLHEVSHFVREGERWYYLDAEA